jgi:molecular chaperone GrpE (heat shock protein)
VLVAQDGYTLHDRVVRPAQVIVSTPAHPQGNSPR